MSSPLAQSPRSEAERQEFLRLLKTVEDFESAARLLADLDPAVWPRHQLGVLARRLQGLLDLADIKIAYLSNFTVDALPPWVSLFAAARGLRCSAYVGGYDRWFEELLDPESSLYRYDPDIIFCSLIMKQLEPAALPALASMDRAGRDSLLESTLQRIESWVRVGLERSRAILLLGNFPAPASPQRGIADLKDRYGEKRFYGELNHRLLDLALEESRVFVFDTAGLCSRFGSDNVHDPKLYYLAKQAWSEAFLPLVAQEMLRYIVAHKGLARKCLVVDLDHTLWGGVVGEEGPEGIRIRPGDPVGEAFLDFQQRIKALKSRGILLAICSKNNRSDVEEALQKHPDMPLQLDDFAAVQINWDPKHLNLERLAEELNIGLDSLVFVDDNPVECDLVRQMLPQVRTICLPQEPEKYASLLDDLVDFEKLVVVDDDLRRGEQYVEKRQRDALKASVGSLEDYLLGLQTRVSLLKASPEHMHRAHQLFTKTNQFNVTTKRYSVSDVEQFMSNCRWELRLVSAQDRFGDLGIVGLYLLDIESPEIVVIDSFILSCRVIGRGIESVAMNSIKKAHGGDSGRPLLGRFVPSAKNKPAEDFFEKQGFWLTLTEPEGEKHYLLPAHACATLACSWIEVVKE